MNVYHGLGVMSGSSLDGIDFALCRFTFDETADNPILEWHIVEAETFELSVFWEERLKKAYLASAKELWLAHVTFGKYIGDLANTFMKRLDIKPNFISSHGHTVFHEPQNHMTLQLGHGAAIAGATGYPVICDFRSTDVALNGQGAPMIPIAENLLFSEYPLCLNIGGIANISARVDSHYIAFDVSPANQVLNKLASLAGQAFDQDGLTARKGILQPELIIALNKMEYFAAPYPKSLDNNWIMKEFYPVIKNFDYSPEDKLNTLCNFIAQRISQELKLICQREQTNFSGKNMLVTGGGAYNQYLMECIAEICRNENGIQVSIPPKTIIEFKEALLMALAGLLRIKNIPNMMKTVTGSMVDNIGGCIYQGTNVLI
ncbi:MAG TPA: anhydro-N-acetylmuramic acid kinase [Saprospiraceae bacterium]|nr:anhydro-N-acetylmuramic acid kinase [Saprospiraceae bacterium]MBX7179705.1 anhydro-N-acetylmuramic acid kinase [Saprospiraceae bacterium]MCB0590545.1 anhydro-N-acetylmuramic acid kinase [Saprospiraceae bacterium]MCO5283636.1 anhydro-N-acetylmuramic acid kinase [Saprospiraceae bacterium]MCO6469479.1 anhydro-N-acetylmuramic acid kinase [Saprospiraceae bacterium]